MHEHTGHILSNPNPILLVDTPIESRGDCACPNSASPEVLDTSNRSFLYDSKRLWTRSSDNVISYLVAGYCLAFNPSASMGPCVLNESAFSYLSDFSIARTLNSDPFDQQLVTQRLIRPVHTIPVRQNSPPEALTAWLHITNACNLDCPYCYVRKSTARMSEEMGLRAIREIYSSARENNFCIVKLKYAGGEVSLHLKLVRTLHALAETLAQQSGIELQEVMLSNGVRLRVKDALWIKESGIKLAISLDGIGGEHDQQRPMRNGAGSFNAVQRTIDEVLLPLGIKPTITITITGQNADHIDRAVEWALERDLPVSLNFYRVNTLSASRQTLELEEAAIIRGMRKAYRVFEDYLPTRYFLNGLLDRVQAQAHSHTCGVGLAYLVITHEGKLAQCQMHLDNPVAHDLNGSLLPLVASGSIQNLPVDEKEGCKNCTYRYRCTGGCPLETYRATGRWDVKSPHCNIYKTLLPEAFRLEGLRLLKVNGYLI